MCLFCELCVLHFVLLSCVISWRKTAFSHIFQNQVHSVKVFCWKVRGMVRSIYFQGRALVKTGKLPTMLLLFVIFSWATENVNFGWTVLSVHVTQCDILLILIHLSFYNTLLSFHKMEAKNWDIPLGSVSQQIPHEG